MPFDHLSKFQCSHLAVAGVGCVWMDSWLQSSPEAWNNVMLWLDWDYPYFHELTRADFFPPPSAEAVVGFFCLVQENSRLENELLETGEKLAECESLASKLQRNLENVLAEKVNPPFPCRACRIKSLFKLLHSSCRFNWYPEAFGVPIQIIQAQPALVTWTAFQLREMKIFHLSRDFILIKAGNLRVKQSSCRSAGIFFPPQHRVLDRPNLQVLSREDDAGGVRFYVASLLELGENRGEQLIMAVLHWAFQNVNFSKDVWVLCIHSLRFRYWDFQPSLKLGIIYHTEMCKC